MGAGRFEHFPKGCLTKQFNKIFEKDSCRGKKMHLQLNAKQTVCLPRVQAK